MRLGIFYWGNRHAWKRCWVMNEWFGVFRNRPNITPGRWGFYLMAFEVGNRNPGGDWTYKTLKKLKGAVWDIEWLGLAFFVGLPVLLLCCFCAVELVKGLMK